LIDRYFIAVSLAMVQGQQLSWTFYSLWRA